MTQILIASPAETLAGPPPPRLAVTVEEGAQMRGISRATLYKLIMRGEVESFTIGRARRIAIVVLEAYARGSHGNSAAHSR